MEVYKVDAVRRQAPRIHNRPHAGAVASILRVDLSHLAGHLLAGIKELHRQPQEGRSERRRAATSCSPPCLSCGGHLVAPAAAGVQTMLGDSGRVRWWW